MADESLVDRLREAHHELRRLPLGGRGHLADVVLEAAEEIEKLISQRDRWAARATELGVELGEARLDLAKHKTAKLHRADRSIPQDLGPSMP